MIKYFCDKCGCELKEEKKISIDMRCYKLFSRMVQSRGHYCADCAITIMGKEVVEQAEREEKERERKRKERAELKAKAKDEDEDEDEDIFDSEEYKYAFEEAVEEDD